MTSARSRSRFCIIRDSNKPKVGTFDMSRLPFQSRIFSHGLILLVLTGCFLPIDAHSQERQLHRAFPIFIFHDDEFWLNLHHFLYVLGRAENKTRDSARPAVSGAPADEQRGFAALT